jgi:hydroxypyruvate isomerase
MPELRYDVNLSILFTELPLLERPAAAAAAGFDAVELWWPFPEPAPPDRQLDELRRALADAGSFPGPAAVPGSGRTSTWPSGSPRRRAARP